MLVADEPRPDTASIIAQADAEGTRLGLAWFEWWQTVPESHRRQDLASIVNGSFDLIGKLVTELERIAGRDERPAT